MDMVNGIGDVQIGATFGIGSLEHSERWLATQRAAAWLLCLTVPSPGVSSHPEPPYAL
jgi:hypothetical protein